MGQALYRKYRSKKLSEIVGQEHITDTLNEALKQGRISHAYLFTGPRGVGKTSIARILAHEINGLPYQDGAPHIDIIEIDAASNRRIDEIRELRDKVYVAPTSAKYKVYIIDEVHMLTREAFNALLKTLEEPPEHVVFILATTDAHKLPETIVSRTQRFTFKPVEKTKVIDHLGEIAKSEGLEVSPEALELLAEHGEGSFRDSISLLDQASNQSGKLGIEDVQRLLGIPPAKVVDGLLDSLSDSSTAEVMQALDSLYGQGYQASAIAKQLARKIRTQMTDGALSLGHESALELLTDLINVPVAYDPERYLEIQLLKHTKPTSLQGKKPEPIKEKAAAKEEPKKAASKPVEKIGTEKPKSAEAPTKAPGNGALDSTVWPDVLAGLKAKHNTLYGVVRMAQPEFTGTGVTLAFAFAFHQKRLKEQANRQKIADIIFDLTGKNVEIECTLNKKATPPTVETPIVQDKSEDLSAISNIFGGAELLES
jgi:DNA polymerase-3 subunit gamma/tau